MRAMGKHLVSTSCVLIALIILAILTISVLAPTTAAYGYEDAEFIVAVTEDDGAAGVIVAANFAASMKATTGAVFTATEDSNAKALSSISERTVVFIDGKTVRYVVGDDTSDLHELTAEGAEKYFEQQGFRFIMTDPEDAPGPEETEPDDQDEGNWDEKYPDIDVIDRDDPRVEDEKEDTQGGEVEPESCVRCFADSDCGSRGVCRDAGTCESFCVPLAAVIPEDVQDEELVEADVSEPGLFSKFWQFLKRLFS